MVYSIRGTSHTTIALDATTPSTTRESQELAESIRKVGLLRPLTVNADGEIIDGRKRAGALLALGETDAPVLRLDRAATDVTQAATIRACCKGHGLATPAFAGASRATLDRVEKVYAIAEDSTLPTHVRVAAAEGVAQIAAGASANGVLTHVNSVVKGQQTVSRYPELAHLSNTDALRMSEYLDAIEDPAAREVELSVLRLTADNTDGDDRALSMGVYAHMQDLARVVDTARAEEVAAALAAAITGSALTPALRDRCLEVADQLERTAHGIRTAMSLDLEHA